MVLNLAPDGLTLIGPDCSSWSICSRCSSKRNFINVRGDNARPWVDQGFAMVSRSLGWVLIALPLAGSSAIGVEY